MGHYKGRMSRAHTLAAVLVAVAIGFGGLTAVPATAYAEPTGGTVKAWGNNFYGTTSLGTANTDANTGVATFTARFSEAGTHYIAAGFTRAGLAHSLLPDSDVVTVEVGAQDTTTTLSANPTSLAWGGSRTLYAPVSPDAEGTV